MSASVMRVNLEMEMNQSSQAVHHIIRNVLRWSSAGAMVSLARVNDALEKASLLPREDAHADLVRSVLMSLRMGVQVPQRDCINAENALKSCLKEMRDAQNDDDFNQPAERG